jgi:hypothetical protein
LTVIVVESPDAVPAAPASVGLVLFVVVPFAGLVSVTAGAPAVNVFAADNPVNPVEEFDCCACAVYRPATNAVVGVTDHFPADAVAVSVCTGVPDALEPL